MAFFKTYVSPTLGSVGRSAALKDVNMTPTQLRGVGGGFPGEVFPLWGNLYQLLQNRSGGDLAEGDSVSLYFGASSRIGNLTANSTTSVLETDDTLSAYMAGNNAWPGYVGVTAGTFATTADEQLRQILANSTAAGASTITIAQADYSDGMVNGAASLSPDVIATPGATYDYETFCPSEVVKTDLDALGTSVGQGVVRSTTISDGNFGVVQIGGFCLAKVDGTTDLVAGDLLIPDSAAGVLSKWTITDNAANTIAAEILRARFVMARILGAYTNNGVGLRLVQLLNNPLLPYPINE